MTLVVRIGTVALLALLLAAPGAFGAVTVAYHEEAHTPPAGTATELTVTGDAQDDNVTVIQSPGSVIVTRAGGGIVTPPVAPCTGDANTVTCPPVHAISIDLAGGADKLTPVTVTVPMAIAGGPGNDELTGGSAGDVLAGGSENDRLNGGGGVDEYFGESGDDFVFSRDAVPERIACGAGNDQVDNDFTDIIAECERGTDTDGDGFSTATDCDDSRANVFPGAPDAENGVDEDCDGHDDVNLDRDGDSFPVPLDCNDADPKIRPGTFEIRGNSVDENCDRRALPFAPLASLVSTKWRLDGATTRLRKFIVRNAPAGARVAVTCDGPGCSFRGRKVAKVKRDLAPVRLHPFFGKGKLRQGAHIVVKITAAGAIGLTYSYRIVRNVLPAAQIKCLVPGAKKAKRC